ncbi:hypothetical protein [Paenibacillus radicis (ex Xue et al. 2023)]|uniref:Alpha-L-rhamnosidase n=1 Tax=Paenibacillus radicis (ex Xue et al. 2023) TaxID=2972489 RepID=A0ABT1YDN9_9BACL|nr:hypothetical protein [Paenibacillus radicis (ex Xue et al. 2023)]MCR8631281.1 hypothetical protein [Paenibacillus radicis (ex Xue et al. 2023)]
MNIYQLKKSFAQANPRFGPVPFWWWSAEEVTEERIRWQMQKFRDGGLRNIGIINLAPTGPQYGSVSDRPVYASEDWWCMFEVALREAERLGMYLWFYDQIGFSGSNMPARIVTESPDMAGYQLRRFLPEEELPESSVVLFATNEHTYASVRQGFNWLDPRATGQLLDRVHGEIERRFPHDLGKTIAGSFQDELPPLPLWTPELSAQYRERFQEELAPHLPALFDPLPGSEQVRRRVYRLAAELAEQSFFIPLGEWHRERGMLICCDQAGPARRADPNGAQRIYLDYFRTHRWYNAPGTDMDGEIKPHSSMVHLHGGSRVFLESFHSSGWGGTLEETMHWLLPWFQAGATVYSPHAVYYSTRGGWWEWAPPDTGWRQPYFEHYPVFADTISRACFLLSEGSHVCDVAVHYPSYAVCGYLSLSDGKVNEHPMGVANRESHERVTHIQSVYRNITGSSNRRSQKQLGVLRQAQIDFDITDDSALHKSELEGSKLKIADERFSVLLLCGTTVMDEEARTRIEAWLNQGGSVIAVNVPEEERDLAHAIYVDTAEEAAAWIEARIPKRVDGPGESLCRKTEDTDVFLLLPAKGTLLSMHQPATPQTILPASAVYRLRTTRTPQYWDPVHGNTEPIAYKREGEWIEVEVPFASWPGALIVCVDEDDLGGAEKVIAKLEDQPARLFPAVVRQSGTEDDSEQTIVLPEKGWQIRAESTLDNRYGDFDLHGDTSQFMPIERRSMSVRVESELTDGEKEGWHKPEIDESEWLTRLWSESTYWLICEGEQYEESRSNPKVYSNVFGDLTMRSWAGRMGRVPRRFLNLGSFKKRELVWAKTYVSAPKGGSYWIRTESNANVTGSINGQEIEWIGGPEERTAWIELWEGSNELLLRFEAIGNGLMRAGVEVNSLAHPQLPKWLFTRQPNPQSSLSKTINCPSEQPYKRVRIVFAARGRAILYVNGIKVTEHGDFNPYIRQGQEEVDITAMWRYGVNEIRFALPEGKGEVFADGLIELLNGQSISFCTGSDWSDEQGGIPGIHHFSILQFAETESLWISARPHPLPQVGWLMPDSVPDPLPLSFSAEPASLGRPVWLRFPMPVGSTRLHIQCAGEMRVWINGSEAAAKGGSAEFAPQPAGAIAAVRIVPNGPYSEAAVLLAPIRFEAVPAEGALGDWRTALCLPHHGGAVEYETDFEVSASTRSGAELELGHVRGTAEAWVDAKPLGVRLWRPYRFALPDLPEGKHSLRIRVTNTLGTYYEVGRPTSLVGGNTDVTYWNQGRHEEEQDWEQWFPSGGLYGPVRIVAGSQD